MHCDCQSREVRWRAAERGMICQKPILFLHNSKARKSKVRCKLSLGLQRQTTNRTGIVTVILLEPAARHPPSYTRFSTAPCPPQCDRNGQLLACALPCPREDARLTIIRIVCCRPTTGLRRFSCASADANSSLTQSQSCSCSACNGVNATRSLPVCREFATGRIPRGLACARSSRSFVVR